MVAPVPRPLVAKKVNGGGQMVVVKALVSAVESHGSAAFPTSPGTDHLRDCCLIKSGDGPPCVTLTGGEPEDGSTNSILFIKASIRSPMAKGKES